MIDMQETIEIKIKLW